MKLKEGEQILKEHFFSKGKDTYNKGILTTNRLICITKASRDSIIEENYPLSKLTSIRIEKEKSGFRSKILGYSIVGLLGCLIAICYMWFGEREPMWTEIAYLLPVCIILIFGIKYGLVPDNVHTSLIISQMGGAKRYSALDSKALGDFIDSINEQLI